MQSDIYGHIRTKMLNFDKGTDIVHTARNVSFFKRIRARFHETRIKPV